MTNQKTVTTDFRIFKSKITLSTSNLRLRNPLNHLFLMGNSWKLHSKSLLQVYSLKIFR